MKKACVSLTFALAATWSLLVLMPPASAQELNLGPIIDPGIAGQAAAQRQIAEQEYKRATGHAWRNPRRDARSSKSGGARAASGGRSGHGSTRFQVSQAARQRRVAAWMSKMRTVDPKGMAQFQRTPAGRNLFAVIGSRLAQYGMRTDDVADALTVYLITAWYGVRGSTQDPPRAVLLATRTQMRASLLSNPAFAAASNATKQEVAEALLLQTIEDGSNLAVGKKDQKQMARVKNQIRQNALQSLHVDLAKLKLTSHGLRA